MEDDKLNRTIEKSYRMVEKARFELWIAMCELQSNASEEDENLIDSLIGLSTAEIVSDDVVKIHIPEYFPRKKELIGTEFKDWWNSRIKKALSHLERVPIYDSAYVLIEIHAKKLYNDWDTDNKAISLVLNSLKGKLFVDDNFKHMSYGVKGYEVVKSDPSIEDFYVDIYVMDYDKYIGKALPFLDAK